MLTSLLAAQTCEKARAKYGDSDNFLKVSALMIMCTNIVVCMLLILEWF